LSVNILSYPTVGSYIIIVLIIKSFNKIVFLIFSLPVDKNKDFRTRAAGKISFGYFIVVVKNKK
jgi:hypothetical protein